MNTATASKHAPGRSALARRISLDILLILILITLYSKNVISLLYHEAVSLTLFLLFILHLVLNRKWIVGLLRGKLAKGAKPRVMAAVNVLLVLSWLAVMVTGILVSKKIFALRMSSLNPIHFFSAAMALVITGIHFGLHWQYFFGFLGKRVHLPRAVTAVLMAVILLFGTWQVFNSSFSRWITAPFTASSQHGEGPHAEGQPLSDLAAETSANDPSATASAEAPASDPSGTVSAEAPAEGSAAPTVAEAPANMSHGQQPFSLLNLLNVIATYFSLIFLFASVTRGIELLLRSSKRRSASKKND